MMDWNQLRQDWQSRSDARPSQVELRPDRHQRLWRRVRFRDGVETAVAALLLPFFGFAAVRAFQTDQWLPGFIAVGLVVTIAYIPFRLWQARRRIPVPDPGQPVLSFLQAERVALRAQADMLRSVARWYSGPTCIGAVAFYLSLAGPGLDALLYALVVAGLFVGVEYANRAAVRKQFEPAIAALDHQISTLQQES
jgi:hypothetical protein